MPPLPVKTALLPVQIVVSGPARITGRGFTLTLTVSEFVHPLASVPVTVYIVVADGVADVTVQETQDSPVPGSQV